MKTAEDYIKLNFHTEVALNDRTKMLFSFNQLVEAMEEYKNQEPQQKGYSEEQVIAFGEMVIKKMNQSDALSKSWTLQSLLQSLPQPNKQESDDTKESQ